MKSIFNKLFGNDRPDQGQSPKNLILHFGYHKSMTMLFKQVLEELAHSCRIPFRHCNSDLSEFLDRVNNGSPQILSVNNVIVPFDKISEPFVGSHIIRDPRDLVVSGYRYHLRCNENWAQKPLDDYMAELLGLSDLDCQKTATGKSFQELLNSVDQQTGLMLELNWRRPHFVQMQNWNYSNPNVVELRYEDVFGNERSMFAALFQHYGFSAQITESAMKLINNISFSNLKKRGQTGEQAHASRGIPSQWKEFFSSDLKSEFKSRHAGLLLERGYEKDSNW